MCGPPFLLPTKQRIMKQLTQNKVKTYGALVTWLALMLLAMAALLLSGGCTRKVYIPTEHIVYSTDTVYEAVLRVDSVIQRDSVAVVQKGDTVLITRYRDRYRVKERTDTVYKAKTDSVRVRELYPVERELTKWEQTKMDFGGMAIGGLIAVVVSAVIVWIVKRKRRK